MSKSVASSHLDRSIGLVALIIYGVGDILGAGIYALVGKVAGLSGSYVWLSFTVAMIVASLTALTYAELGGRLPKAGGVAHFAHQAFKKDWLSVIVGWLMLATCLVSMATGAKAFTGYLQAFFPQLPSWLIVLILFSALAAVVYRGIRETTWLNMLCTGLEVSGLVVVLIVASLFVFSGSSGPASEVVAASATETLQWSLVIQGACLAFYAFIGFEDLVNLAEEVKNPERNIPIAIVVSLSIAGLVYIAISWLSSNVIAPADLAHSNAPLVDVVRVAAPSFPSIIFSAVALFAILNTALLNYVTASRLIYGMAEEKLLPPYFARIHPTRHTPHRAIGAIFPILLALAMGGSLQALAGGTATLILIVFIVVNFSLLKIKKSQKNYSGFQVPSFLPWIALISNGILIAFAATASHWLAVIVIGIGILLYLIRMMTMKK